jgi:hypothetical protein
MTSQFSVASVGLFQVHCTHLLIVIMPILIVVLEHMKLQIHLFFAEELEDSLEQII